MRPPRLSTGNDLTNRALDELFQKAFEQESDKMTDNISDNEFIHTVILKQDCWHDVVLVEGGRGAIDLTYCKKCGKQYTANPAYSESLDLLAPVEQKAIEEHPGTYGYFLVCELGGDVKAAYDRNWMSEKPIEAIATASSQVRARAIRKLYEAAQMQKRPAESATRKEAKSDGN